MKFTLEKTLVFYFFLAAIALVSVLVIFYFDTQKIKSTSDLVEHTQEVLRKSDNVLLDILNIETGSRGYIITGNNFFLEPFNNAITTINRHLSELAILTKDNPHQQLRINSLKKVVEERLVFTKYSIEVRKLNGLEGTEKIIANEKGKILTDKIRNIISDINSEELRLLKQRKQGVEKDIQYFTLVFIALLAVVIIVLITVYVLITTNLKVLKKTEETLYQLNKKLVFQYEEKEKRAAELVIANEELVFQSEEKEKRAAELIITNKELKKTGEELLAVNKELETFTYSVSHDLRAPLRAINGYATILKEDYAEKLDADGVIAIHAIQKNSKKMGELIDDLLAFSRLGRKAVPTSEINMTSLVNSVRQELMIGNSNEIEFKIPELLPAMGQKELIKQVWVNLISNAIKFSKNKSKIRIEIGSYYQNNFVVYSIKDNGAGFDMQYYDKLFGVFQRLHSQEEFEGTGIGLSIVQKIVQRHNGTIWAESKLNEGSCFYFSLPIINF